MISTFCRSYLLHGIPNDVLFEMSTRTLVNKKKNIRRVYFPAIYTEYNGIYSL